MEDLEILWDLFHFFTSFWAFCIDDFKGIPMNVLKLNWHLACTL